MEKERERGVTPLVEVWRCLLGFLIPFLWALYDWLCAVWFFDFAISNLITQPKKKRRKITEK